MSVHDVLSSLKEWVKTGRALKACHIIIVYDLIAKKHFPHYIFNNEIDDAWGSFDKSKESPMISFDLNKKVFGVDDDSKS